MAVRWSLKDILEFLDKQDPATVFVCRRIHTLGFKSAEALKQHFTAYGRPLAVLITCSCTKSPRWVQGEPAVDANGKYVRRLRPASFGFVVMENAEAVKRILSEGTEHVVRGQVIRVDVFHQRPPPSEVEEVDFEAKDVEGDVEDLSPQICDTVEEGHESTDDDHGGQDPNADAHPGFCADRRISPSLTSQDTRDAPTRAEHDALDSSPAFPMAVQVLLFRMISEEELRTAMAEQYFD
jgi:hypothetical protein